MDSREYGMPREADPVSRRGSSRSGAQSAVRDCAPDLEHAHRIGSRAALEQAHPAGTARQVQPPALAGRLEFEQRGRKRLRRRLVAQGQGALRIYPFALRGDEVLDVPRPRARRHDDFDPRVRIHAD
jgi:hypothetical protein